MLMIYSKIIQYLPYICIIGSIISSIVIALAGKKIKCAWKNYSVLGNLLSMFGDDKDKKDDECK